MRWLHVPHLKESGRPMWCGNHSRMQAVQILGCMQEERMQPTLRTYHHSCTQKKMRPDSLEDSQEYYCHQIRFDCVTAQQTGIHEARNLSAGP